MFLSANIFKLDILFGDLLYNKMIFNRNVLHFGMHYGILRDTDGFGVIEKDGNRPFKVCFIQRTCVQQAFSVIYSSSAMDNEIEDCFYLTMKQDNHLDRMLLHWYSYDHQHFLPNLHLYNLG